jgi:hypothetical protein
MVLEKDLELTTDELDLVRGAAAADGGSIEAVMNQAGHYAAIFSIFGRGLGSAAASGFATGAGRQG